MNTMTRNVRNFLSQVTNNDKKHKKLPFASDQYRSRVLLHKKVIRDMIIF